MVDHVEGAVEWRPEWEGADREKFEQLLQAYARDISVMRAIRKALDLSQVEVATALEMTQSNISKLETTGDPALSVLRRLAEAKGAKLDLTLTTADGKRLAFAL